MLRGKRRGGLSGLEVGIMHLFWVSALAVLIAYTVKGLTGFANTLVFSTIMSFFPYNLAQITPLELVLGTPSNFFIA